MAHWLFHLCLYRLTLQTAKQQGHCVTCRPQGELAGNHTWTIRTSIQLDVLCVGCLLQVPLHCWVLHLVGCHLDCVPSAGQGCCLLESCLLFSSLARHNMAITSQTLVVQTLIFLNVGPAGILDPPFVQPLNGGKHRLPSNSLLIAFRLSRGGIFLVTCQILRHHTVATAIDTP